jgi:hypothetical protein
VRGCPSQHMGSQIWSPGCHNVDRGTQFCSAVWAVLCKTLNINHITTTAFHPQANGMLERAHQQLKDALRAQLAGTDWPQHLPWLLLGLLAAPKEDSAISSAELVFGAPLTLPGQLRSAEELPVETFVQRSGSAADKSAAQQRSSGASRRIDGRPLCVCAARPQGHTISTVVPRAL